MSNDEDQMVHLLDALCWDYTSEDHDWLSKLEIFKTLLVGNGKIQHMIRR